MMQLAHYMACLSLDVGPDDIVWTSAISGCVMQIVLFIHEAPVILLTSMQILTIFVLKV